MENSLESLSFVNYYFGNMFGKRKRREFRLSLSPLLAVMFKSYRGKQMISCQLRKAPIQFWYCFQRIFLTIFERSSQEEIFHKKHDSKIIFLDLPKKQVNTFSGITISFFTPVNTKHKNLPPWFIEPCWSLYQNQTYGKNYNPLIITFPYNQ